MSSASPCLLLRSDSFSWSPVLEKVVRGLLSQSVKECRVQLSRDGLPQELQEGRRGGGGGLENTHISCQISHLLQRCSCWSLLVWRSSLSVENVFGSQCGLLLLICSRDIRFQWSSRLIRRQMITRVFLHCPCLTPGIVRWFKTSFVFLHSLPKHPPIGFPRPGHFIALDVQSLEM